MRMFSQYRNALYAAWVDVEKHDDNCRSANDVLGKAQWAIGNINGQRARIEISILLHDAAVHGLCGWSRPTVGGVTCGEAPFGGRTSA